MATSHSTTNRLASSASAYLRSAAHQPIDWFEFGPEAFAAAKAQNKPILLDIGAVWCHWCHVIDRESYENPAIAQLINHHFIAVKVDRDERPDVDARYQHVISRMTGSGGWPLTAFLDDEGEVFYGGTYYPPQAMTQLLQQLPVAYQEKKQDIINSRTTADFWAPDKKLDTTYQPGSKFIIGVINACRNAYDKTNGGFGQAPKFPHFSVLQLLSAYVHTNPDATDMRQLLAHTLGAMSRGGIYDQLAGGFHRYSVDAHWHVPHFEKMAYDNAEALSAYTWGSLVLDQPDFQAVAKHIAQWVLNDLALPGGGYGASQDADIDLNDDGDHFTWTLDDIRAILIPDEARLVEAYYGLTLEGDMHDRPGRNVLRVTLPLKQVAEDLGLNAAQLPVAVQKLVTARLNRPIPYIDQRMYTNWSAMLAVGMMQTGYWLAMPQAKAHGLLTIDLLIASRLAGNTPDALTVAHADGIPGTLDDLAWLCKACLTAYDITLNDKYRQDALLLAQTMVAQLADPTEGGFLDVPRSAAMQPDVQPLGLLKHPRKPVEDTPSSSANGIALQCLVTLHHLGYDEFEPVIMRSLTALCYQTQRYGLYVSALGLALMQWLNPPVKLSVSATVADQVLTLRQQAGAWHRLLAVETHLPNDVIAIPCEGTTCHQPLTNASQLADFFSFSHL